MLPQPCARISAAVSSPPTSSQPEKNPLATRSYAVPSVASTVRSANTCAAVSGVSSVAALSSADGSRPVGDGDGVGEAPWSSALLPSSVLPAVLPAGLPAPGRRPPPAPARPRPAPGA